MIVCERTCPGRRSWAWAKSLDCIKGRKVRRNHCIPTTNPCSSRPWQISRNLSVASLRCVFLDEQEHINWTSNVVMACVLQATGPMVAAGNKNANNLPIGADGMRDWSFGLFDCFARCDLCTYQNWSTTRATTRGHFPYNLLTSPFPFRPQVAGPPGARASSTAKTDSACAICNGRAPLCQVAVEDTTTNVSFMAH